MHRDADTQWTMRDLFEKAAVPQNVHIGVVWQVDRETDAAFMRLAGEQCWMLQVAPLDMCKPFVRMYLSVLASFLQHCHDEWTAAQQRQAYCTLITLSCTGNLQVREIVLDYREATGPCKARRLCQSLWAGEPYVLQVDAHTRCVQAL